MAVKFEDIYEGQTLYDKWREVEVLWKGTRTNASNVVVHDVYVKYVNTINGSPVLVGDLNLSEEPVHCWSCQRKLIDNVRLYVCDKCQRAICTDSTCGECHCDTVWDPGLKRRIKITR